MQVYGELLFIGKKIMDSGSTNKSRKNMEKGVGHSGKLIQETLRL